MCCFQERKCLGNILEHTLEEIWNSPLAEEIRKVTMEGNLHRTCKIESCPFFRKTHLEPTTKITHRRMPVEFEIDIPTQHCNIGGEIPTKKNPACLMCERSLRDPKDFWQHDRLNEVCDRIKGHMGTARWLHVQGVAEPFWKGRIFEILERLAVAQHGERMWISTTTNGTLMTQRIRAQFLTYAKSTITWSMDAGSPEVYQTIRRVDMYDRIVENLRAYCQERDRCRQYVHIHNNINTINIQDVIRMVEVAADVGVDRLDFNPTYGIPSICVSSENVHIFREAQEKIIERSRQLGVFTTFMRDFSLDIQ